MVGNSLRQQDKNQREICSLFFSVSVLFQTRAEKSIHFSMRWRDVLCGMWVWIMATGPDTALAPI